MDYLKHYVEKFNMFKDLLGKEDPVIVEIGAHYGEDSLRFLETFENPALYCFEPDPRNIAVFKKYVSSDKVKLFEVALSNESGQAEFFQSHIEEQSSFVPEKYDWIDLEDFVEHKLGASGASSLKKGYDNTFAESITVETKRFDKWYLENKVANIDLAWIDVQGAEKDVLEGMGYAIRNIDLIWIEYGETLYEDALSRSETIETLSTKGFRLVEQCSDKVPAGDLLFERID